jgi:hypothetical protein
MTLHESEEFMGKALKVAAIVPGYCKAFITQAMSASGSPMR